MPADPISPACDLANAPLHSSTSPLHRILVVDDDVDTCWVIARVLKGSGYEVDAAKDGEVAWVALQLNSYDLLITDHEMPKMTRVELIKKLYTDGMALPVILVSGAMPTEELNRHPWLQLAAMLTKPDTIEQLLRTVKEAFLPAAGVG